MHIDFGKGKHVPYICCVCTKSVNLGEQSKPVVLLKSTDLSLFFYCVIRISYFFIHEFLKW